MVRNAAYTVVAAPLNAESVIYGHLHMSSRINVDGVDHIETSLGYPREWQGRETAQAWPYPVLRSFAEEGTP